MEALNSQRNALADKGISGAAPLNAREGLIEESKDAESGAEKACRRAVKTKVKADDAEKTLNVLHPGSRPDKEP